MWIRRVDARAFGPFHDAVLEPAAQMTVVVGPNESGKSSWTAAMYAGLCGMRRGRGARMLEDREFEARHKPWRGDRWEVACVIKLADGRSIQLSNDLAGGVNCKATDLDLGHDVSDQIIYEGSPDGSRWLELDRRAFRSVAFIGQAEILDVTKRVDALQDHLQRAAATAGADETAAAALNALDDYRRQRIGTERARTKPLVQSRARLQAVEEDFQRARVAHETWLNDASKIDDLERAAGEARDALEAADRAHAATEAALARQEADRLAEHAGRARLLAEQLPQEPPTTLGDEALAEQVAEAIEAWKHRPEPVALDGESVTEFERRLCDLPDVLAGDLEPEPAVTAATRALEEERGRLRLHGEQRPEIIEPPGVGGLTEDELLTLARELQADVPVTDPSLRAQVEHLRAGGSNDGHRTRLVAGLGALSVGLVVSGLAAVSDLLVLAIPGVVFFLAGLVALIVSATDRGSADPSAAVRKAEARLELAEQAAAAGRARVERAAAQARYRGLDPDPQVLLDLARALREAVHSTQAVRSWEERQLEFVHRIERARVPLAEALHARGVTVATEAGDADLDDALQSYLRSCAERRDQAQRASGRSGLEQALRERQRLEEAATVAAERIAAAASQLQQAAQSTETLEPGSGAAPEQLVAALEEWQRNRASRQRHIEGAREDWRELQSLLEGGSVFELQARAEKADERATQLHAATGSQPGEAVDLGPDPRATITELRRRFRELENEAISARSAHDADGGRLRSVPEAEEAVEEARRERDRIESVDHVLDTTRAFLAAAQERVHRDIAPVLATKVKDRLARITGNRYRDVIVDPAALTVQVRQPDGEWQDAGLLSHGTAEQVYLLLRVAMAEILTGAAGPCPLLLDDTTVQSDPARTRAVLAVLHEISREHQVILFSQEDEVRRWAEANLTGFDALLELTDPSTAPTPVATAG